VTLAGWLIMVGSVFALGLVVQRLADLHTLENLRAIETFLAKPPGSDLGVSTDTAVTALRTLLMVTAGCATAAGILGYQVLRRSRSARTAVTVLAVPLFLAGMVTGGFVTSVVAASAVILWLQPARSWFDGTAPPQRRTAPAAPPAPSSTASPRQGAPAESVAPRPAAVLWACLLTWACSGVLALVIAASAVALAVSPHLALDEVHRQNPDLAAQGISDDLLIGVSYLMLAGLVGWCVGAALLAVLVLRRVDWARIVLIVSAACCGALCLVGVALGAFLLVITLLGSAAVIVLLVRPDTRSWFARRDAPTT
jgi:hypothetical protein